MTSPLANKRVLFVDDRYEMAVLQIERVRACGATVSHRARILDALEELHSHSFDLAVIDLHMPIPNQPWPAHFQSSIEAITCHESENIRSHNGGQIVGHFINDAMSGLPRFIYMSAVAPFFEPLAGAEPDGQLICYNRYDLKTSDLIDILEALTSDTEA